jgi:hypothetical protein
MTFAPFTIRSRNSIFLFLIGCTGFIGLLDFGLIVDAFSPERRASGTFGEVYLPIIYFTGGFLVMLLLSDQVRSKVTLQGTILTITMGRLFKRTHQVDVTHLTSVTTQLISVVKGRRAYAIVFQDTSGAQVSLGLNEYKAKDLSALLAALRPLLTAQSIVTDQQIDAFLKSPAATTASSDGSVPELPQLKRRSRRVTFAISFAVITFVVAVIGMALFSAKQDALCQALDRNGVETTATVETLGLYRTRSRVHRGTPHIAVATIQEADALEMTLRFTTDKATVSEPLKVRYAYHADLETLYNEAETGSLRIRYQAANPAKLRPASEFPNSGQKKLCEESVY